MGVVRNQELDVDEIQHVLPVKIAVLDDVLQDFFYNYIPYYKIGGSERY